ncbi:thioredoxin family protein [Clostridium sp.]|uniref:thioredoxin family protein n=1 Tax=Clostridium sp. TaxID=1506 RepID=UPI0026344D62|nr:thioredoxin domain-containing protein [uncultured Clostridium sp.]
MLELTKDNFEEEVLKSEKPVFVDFWGEKCKACLRFMPGVNELSKKYSDKIKFASLNISTARRTAIGQGVLGLPTMVIYSEAEKISTITPDKISSLEDIENFIKQYYDTL